MPNRPLRPCKKAGCRELVHSGYCAAHSRTHAQDIRRSSQERGYTSRWRRESKAFLAAHPWCAICLDKGRYEPATEVDHIVPHRGDMRLFWDKSNWQGLSRGCHSSKTAREDGGFGNTPHPQKE